MEANNKNQALYTLSNKGRYKGKKPYKITKGKFCRNYKQASHDIKDYYFLFPDKAPKSQKRPNNKAKKDDKKEVEKSARDTRNDNIDVLYSKMLPNNILTNLGDIDINFNIKNIQVNIT